jgi:hypothetical protein
MKVLFALAGLLLACTASAQKPTAAATVDKTNQEPCTVAGQVVRLGESTPLRKANVQLLSVEPDGTSVATRTGEDGKFRFDKITPGRYRLMVTRHGYVPQEFGQRKPSDPPANLSLRSGQKMTDLFFRLTPAAAIGGHAQDEDGDPMPWVHITVFQLTHYNGELSVALVGENGTNDLGEYRVYNLPPGRYFIAATYEPGSSFVNGRRAMRGDDSLNPGYLTTYYPNTDDPQKAVAIRLKAGDELTSIDVILRPSRGVKVKGHVYNGTGKTLGGASVRLVLKDSQRNYFQAPEGYPSPTDGSFEIQNVPPGSYSATAYSFIEGKIYAAKQSLDVGQVDVEGLNITLSTGQEFSGRLVWDGKPEATKGEVRIFLQSVEVPMPGGRATAKADGSFVISNVPDGQARVTVSGLGENSFMKSVRYGTSESTSREVNITPGANASLEITLSSRGGHITGMATTSEGLPGSAVWVVLVPDAANRNKYWLYKSANTDQNGIFEFRGIVPGQYEVFSWDQVDEGAWEDPAFINAFDDKRQGENVTIREGETKVVNITTIHVDALQDQP